ncbi:MAG: TIGR02147 family protein [Deltaproteobacteria bacterium]|nr:MAG: TIGR02147 family protein [Deltaproteobacteria bacterium]
MKSSSFLKLIIDGKRNLAQKSIRKIAQAFSLDEKSEMFFYDMVQYNQAKKADERDFFFRKLAQHLHLSNVKTIDPIHHFIFSKWYFFPILEIVRMRIRRGEVKDELWIQKYLRPELELSVIKEAIAILTKAGLLKRTSQGYVRKDPLLSISDDADSPHLLEFYRSYCRLASRSLLIDPEISRAFSVLTVAISRQGFEKAKEEIVAFAKRLHMILENEAPENREILATLNIQLFQLASLQKQASFSV